MNVIVGKSKIGKGLFAAKDIRKNSFLFSVQGKKRKEKYSPSFARVGPRWLAIGKETWLLPKRTGKWWYLNHSCNPNAGLKGKKLLLQCRT